LARISKKWNKTGRRTKERILKKYCKKLLKGLSASSYFGSFFVSAVDFVQRKMVVGSVSDEKNLKFMHLLQKRY